VAIASIDRKVPVEESLGAIKRRRMPENPAVGLSEVTVGGNRTGKKVRADCQLSEPIQHHGPRVGGRAQLFCPPRKETKKKIWEIFSPKISPWGGGAPEKFRAAVGAVLLNKSGNAFGSRAKRHNVSVVQCARLATAIDRRSCCRSGHIVARSISEENMTRRNSSSFGRLEEDRRLRGRVEGWLAPSRILSILSNQILIASQFLRESPTPPNPELWKSIA